MFYSTIALLAFLAALLLSSLLYIKNIKTKIASAANMCSLLAFLFSMVYLLNMLASGIDDMSRVAGILATAILMNLYACVFNVAARVWERLVNLMELRAAMRRLSSRSTRPLPSRRTARSSVSLHTRATGRM